MKSKTFGVLNKWLSDHNSLELLYTETKWASLMSYGMTVDILKDVLPVSDSLDAETVRHHLHNSGRLQGSKTSPGSSPASRINGKSSPGLASH